MDKFLRNKVKVDMLLRAVYHGTLLWGKARTYSSLKNPRVFAHLSPPFAFQLLILDNCYSLNCIRQSSYAVNLIVLRGGSFKSDTLMPLLKKLFIERVECDKKSAQPPLSLA